MTRITRLRFRLGPAIVHALSIGAMAAAGCANGGPGLGEGGSGLGGAPEGPTSSSSEAASTSSTSTTSASSSTSSTSATSASSTTSASSSTSGGGCAIGHLVISEIRTRGAGGANDEFVELFNATGAAVSLDSTWKLEARSTTSASYTSRWAGSGSTVPAWGHYLIVGNTYAGATAPDGTLTSGITDASSVRLLHATTPVDALCFSYDATTRAAYDATYTCEGIPIDNTPHNNTAAGNVDASLERKPGGSAGNCTDTDQSALDFAVVMPATPQNAASAPTP